MFNSSFTDAPLIQLPLETDFCFKDRGPPEVALGQNTGVQYSADLSEPQRGNDLTMHSRLPVTGGVRFSGHSDLR